jgi:uncharacterized protein (TIGR02391 family)
VEVQTVPDQLPYLSEGSQAWALRNLPFLHAVFADFCREGDWPSVDVLQRRLVKQGERLNVSEAAYALPQDLGHLESTQMLHEQQIVLTVLALGFLDEARDLLGDFIRVLRLTVERYQATDEGVQVAVRRQDLVDALGIDDRQATKLSHILLRGGVRFMGGGTTEIETWERTIHEPALVPFLDVEDIDGFYKVEASLRTRSFERTALLPHHAVHPDPSEAQIPPFGLHPTVEQACGGLFEDGHYAEAVEKSFKVVRDRLRVLTGFETGSDAFGRGGLRIPGAAAAHVIDDFNRAVKFLTMAIDNFRNEKSHSSDGHITDPARAREYLSMSSLAMHLLDQAEISE